MLRNLDTIYDIARSSKNFLTEINFSENIFLVYRGYNDQQQEMSQGCKNMGHYNEPLQERTQRWGHVSQDNGQWHGERKLMRWCASAYMGSIYFIIPVAYGMNHVYTVVDTFIFPIQLQGLGRNVAVMAAFLLPVPTLRKI
jgi:hypothetical protein